MSKSNDFQTETILRKEKEMTKKHFYTESSLIDILKKGEMKDFPKANEKKSYVSRFLELDKHFSEFPVEMGTMKKEIDLWIDSLKTQMEDVASISDEPERIRKVSELLLEDNVIFLNKHGPEHTMKVIEKAFDILKCFVQDTPSYYEIFLLLCSVSVHDVGNLFGRTSHEKRIYSMIDSECDNIIDDTVERRVISRIAGVHGGRINGTKDTISFLEEKNTINNFEIREQMLASVLRFADELADDNTRANDPALKLGILGEESEIYHVYSSKLHTVKLHQNPVTTAWEVVLKFEIDEETAQKQFKKCGRKVYLLDEIYERTIKMEQERRYCMRFLRVYCLIEKINVEITIESNESVFNQEKIKYVLQENGYPDAPYKNIKDISEKILSGAEMAEKLRKQDQGGEYE